MPMIIKVAIGIAAALAAVWVSLVAVLLMLRPRGGSLREAARLLPDTLRMLKGMATDGRVPLRARIWLWLLLVYLAIPFDLVPDFIPVIGYADDAIIALLVLRAVVRRAGPAAIRRHWSGTEDGLRVVARAAGMTIDSGRKGQRSPQARSAFGGRPRGGVRSPARRRPRCAAR